MNKFKVISSSEISTGSMESVLVNGKQLMIVKADGKFYALDDLCSHAQCSLGTEGLLDGMTIICGCHGAKYDVVTGKVLSLPGTHDLNTYQIEEKNGDLYVTI
jgi:3-phenylpropionate/trans-cinnamate dioxygenase ferredoxin component